MRFKEKINIKKSENESIDFSKRYWWSSGRPLTPFYFLWFWSIYLKWTNFVPRTSSISFWKMNRFFFWFFYINPFNFTDKLMVNFLKIPKIQFWESIDDCWTYQITLFVWKIGQKVFFLVKISKNEFSHWIPYEKLIQEI